MSVAVRVNAVLTVLLAAVFGYAFNVLKHDPALSRLIPFANDPYDSVGSFAAIVVLPLAILALLRAFRHSTRNMPIAMGIVRAVRVQVAVVLAVLVTVCADTVALLRHPARWSGVSGAVEVITILVGLVVIAGGLGIAMRRTLDNPSVDSPAGASRRSVMATTVSIVVLALFPESIVKTVVGELLALATGIVLLFWLMSSWLVVLVPGEMSLARDDQSSHRTHGSRLAWAGAVTAGLAVGGYLLWLESHEDGGIAPGKVLLVACVYLGAGAFGLATALAFLRKPLGLNRLG
jgi:hypothetical protein